MKWFAALSATCLLSLLPISLSEVLADHRRGRGSIRHSREYQDRKIELEIEFEDRNALQIERERISAAEEARREPERRKRSIEIEREREQKTRDFLDFQEALRESSRASRRAPRSHYYRKPGHEVSSLPYGHRKVSVKGDEYHYSRGVFFRGIPSGFVVVTAPGGAVVDELPDGHTVVSPGEEGLYYFFGTFFAEVPGGFEVVRPSAGAVVYYLPDGYQSTHVDGDLLYVFGGIHYRPYYRDGILVYAVVEG
jgi:hypothetical protein